MDLNVERYGKGEKLLFLHGAGGSSSSFYFQRKYLQKSSEVILLDLPGHGKSPGRGCREAAEYVEVVKTAISDAGLERCFVAGHSMGGLIAMSLALAYPALVRGLILITTAARLHVSPEILEWVMADKEKAVRMMMGLAFSPKTPSSFVEGAIAEMMKTPAEVIFGDLYACEQADLTERVKEITVPALIICAGDDVLTPPALSGYLNGAIRGSTMVSIADAGHMVTLEKPKEASRAIEAFVIHR